MYPASLVENCSPGLDDDPRVSVLINRSVTKDALSTPGFRHAVGLFFRLLLFSADLGKFFHYLVVVVAVEKWEAQSAFQAQRLFHGPSRYRCLKRLMFIFVAAGQHSPGDASQFVRLRPCCAVHVGRADAPTDRILQCCT